MDIFTHKSIKSVFANCSLDSLQELETRIVGSQPPFGWDVWEKNDMNIGIEQSLSHLAKNTIDRELW